jgi:hypothetical protein
MSRLLVFLGVSRIAMMTPLSVDDCVARLKEATDPWWSFAVFPDHDAAASTSHTALSDRASFRLRRTQTPYSLNNYRRWNGASAIVAGTLVHDGTVTRIAAHTRLTIFFYAFAAFYLSGFSYLVETAITVASGNADPDSTAAARTFALAAGAYAVLGLLIAAITLNRARAERNFLVRFLRETLAAE